MRPSAPVDLEPLARPVDRSRARELGVRFRQEFPVQPVYARIQHRLFRRWQGAISVAAAALGILIVTYFALTLLLGAVIGSSAAGVIAGIAPWFLLAGAAVSVGVTLWQANARRDDRWARLDAFATANGLGFAPAASMSDKPGMIFRAGSRRYLSDLVSGTRGRRVEVGNFSYVTYSGEEDESMKEHRWGYIGIRLDVPLPHIVLDAARTNGLGGRSNLPERFARDQRLSLEGDFDRHFTLYCPKDYERDALYLLTPDVMARLIDLAAGVDVEIIDDWLFLYSPKDLSTTDPETWHWVFSTIDALTAKLDQWARWRDERMTIPANSPDAAALSDVGEERATTPSPDQTPDRATPQVAEAGRRLRVRQVTWVGIALIVLIAGWMLWDWISGAISFFTP